MVMVKESESAVVSSSLVFSIAAVWDFLAVGLCTYFCRICPSSELQLLLRITFA